MVARTFPDMPIVLYNVPIRTAVDVAPETVARLRRDHDNVVGVKETTKDFEHFSRVLPPVRSRHADVVGHRAAVPARCSPSAASASSAPSTNLAPSAVANMYDLFVAGDTEKALDIHYGLHPLVDLMFVETNPAPIKDVLSRAGQIASGHVRPPLVTPTAAGRQRIDAAPGRGCADARRAARPSRRLAGPRLMPSSPATATGQDVLESLPSTIQHYMGGEHVKSADGATIAVTDPVSQEPYCTLAAGGPEDVDNAVAAARDAFLDGEWAGMSARRRSRTLNAIADALEARADLLATFESFDTGLPITQSRGLGARAAENFRFFADVCSTLHEDAFRSGSQLGYVIRRPKGVAGLITPWNAPLMLATWKIAPCLASGCTLVLKPAELTPLSASLLPEIMEEAGLPAGVFNIVHGVGERAGAALVEHPDVPVISFTGETTTGRAIMRSASAHLKGLSMELGGKSPCIVFADASVPAALDSALFGVFSLNGERCTAGSRVLVERPLYDEFVTRLGERAAAIRVGDPMDPATELGALVSAEHYARVLSYVEAGKSEGARLVTGGHRPEHLQTGNYLAPTVFADVGPEMRIFQEEIFGPVVCVTPFDDEEHAIQLANDTAYGLAAYLWTDDLRRGHRVAHRIEAGMLWLNSHNVRDLRTPFGGMKNSGLGREGGQHSLDFYTESSIVHVALGDTHVPRFGAD